MPFSSLTLEHEARSSDGTVKALLRTADGRPLEAVLMRYRDGRRSLCLSSQSGCPLTCTFCATGQMRFGRNLTASEIIDQALSLPAHAGRVDHAVFMGMGEPMMNIDAVLEACAQLPDVGISNRHTAISTIGWIPGIERLAAEREADPAGAVAARRRSAAALAADAGQRPLPARRRARRRAAAYYERKRRMVFVEYVMLAGVNDSFAQAQALAELLDPRMFKVNLIPYNPTGSQYRGLEPEGDRRVPRRARAPRAERHRARHARARHRRRLRPARGRPRGGMTPGTPRDAAGCSVSALARRLTAQLLAGRPARDPVAAVRACSPSRARTRAERSARDPRADPRACTPPTSTAP